MLEEIMPTATVRRHRTPSSLSIAVALLLALPIGMLAQAGQGGRGQRGGAPAGAPGAPGAPPAGGPAAAAPAGQRGGGGAGAGSAKAAAPVDITGYWVSIVTEDWIERMCPDCPRSGTGGRGGGGGGFGGGQGAPAPAPTAANADPCRAYGAGGSLRVPGRLDITWADDNTLQIDMDAGTQTRLVHFNPIQPPSTEKTLQGYSAGTWEVGGGGGGRGGGGGGGRGGGGAAGGTARWGSLKVVTTNMKGGYLLSSRSSYGDNAVLTEHFTRHTDFGTDYFTVTAQVDDGNQTRVTSSTFKKEPNGSKFAPSACEPIR